MRCSICKRGETRVLESRESGGAMRRRRECEKCGRRFTTYERIEITNLVVIKRDGGREQFDSAKVRAGILRASEKRPVPMVQVDRMVDEIEAELRAGPRTEVTSKRVGELVMRRLKRVDKVAYIRFASVYLDFKDPEDFEAATRALLGKR
jgi:transcriptional repressor NrdR